MILANCHTTDPEYNQLLSSAETNPDRNDVVGTWYSRSQSKNLMMDMSSEGVMKVYANGTASIKSKMSGRGGVMAMPSETEGSKKWSYKGNGIWTASVGFGHKETWRLSKGRLLVESKASTGGLGSFIGRHVMVNANDKKAVDDEYRRDGTTKDSAWGL